MYTRQKEIIKIIIEQIKFCMGNMRLWSTSGDFHLLRLEYSHFESLLDVLQSKIDIKSYLEKFHSIFQLDVWNEHLTVYTPQLFILKRIPDKNAIINLDSKLLCFVKVLEICKENLKKHIDNEDYTLIEDEYYYNHNVPSLIILDHEKLNNDAIKYYLTVECKGCRSFSNNGMASSYEDVWKEISEQYSIDFK